MYVHYNENYIELANKLSQLKVKTFKNHKLYGKGCVFFCQQLFPCNSDKKLERTT